MAAAYSGSNRASRQRAARGGVGTGELLFVLDGPLELRVVQHAEVRAKGDSASFAGGLAPECVKAGSAVARFALTVYEPAVGGGGTG